MCILYIFVSSNLYKRIKIRGLFAIILELRENDLG